MDSRVSLELFAEICADLHAGMSREDALYRADVTAEEWKVAETTWPRRIAEDIASGGSLRKRYRAVFDARLGVASIHDTATPPASDSSETATQIEIDPAWLAVRSRDDDDDDDAGTGPNGTIVPPAVATNEDTQTTASIESTTKTEVMPGRGVRKATQELERVALKDALPFKRPGPSLFERPMASRPPRLTLEQFASLSAEIAVAPTETAVVRARYGLDDAMHLAERDEWQRRFVDDKELYARYAHLFQSFRDYLAGERR